jgi:sugar lactone lactonase YvrE
MRLDASHVRVPSACALGEGPLWDDRAARLWWVDIFAPAIWSLDSVSGETRKIDCPERVGFVALTVDPDVLVAGFKFGLATIDTRSGAWTRMTNAEPNLPGNRINDGIAAPDARVFYGTMDDACETPSGRFWIYDPRTRQSASFGPQMICTNGPAFSRAAGCLYAVNTMQRCIDVYAMREGVPTSPRRFVTFDDPSWGLPDGVIVDAEDHVWCGHWGGACVTRFAPNGHVERTIHLPVPNVTKCAFGGGDLKTLFITTAADGVDRSAHPLAGHLFSCECDVAGLPAPRINTIE